VLPFSGLAFVELMSHRYLCKRCAPRHTRVVRLPQVRSASLSTRISTTSLFALALLMPLYVQGATAHLQSSPSSLHFGIVSIGQKQTQLVALTNTGQRSITISAVSISASEFRVSGVKLPLNLGAGKAVDLRVTFFPTVTGWLGGTITVASNASNPNLQIQVQGNGVTSDPLTAAPARLWFGKVPVGQSSSLSVVLTNVRSSSETLISLSTSGSGFSVSGPTFPLVLKAGQTATLTITFTPKAAGLAGGGVLVHGPNLNVPFTGTGITVGQLAISPATLNFGNVYIGSSGTQTSILSAVGGSVTVSSATSNNPQYVVSGATFPMTIKAGQSADLSLVFSPTLTGTDSATLTISSNASDAQVIESLTGAGMSTPYTVNLTWDASTSPVVGYNVYRGAKAGLYSKINSSLNPTTTYSDATVASGKTYYYAATAVDSSGQESAYSTPVKVVVP